MLTALIRKDESTEVPRQVPDMAAARALLTEGMPVFILGEDGSKTLVLAEDAVQVVEEQPPIDNDHVEPGAEQFAPDVIEGADAAPAADAPQA